MLNIAIPTACLLGGRCVRITVNDNGMSTPPVKPCNARNTIIMVSEWAWPQQTENTIKRTVFTSRYFRRENACASHAVSGITTISATRYAVGTHDISSELAARVPAMSRSDALVTMMSSTAMKHPSRVPVTAIQVLRDTRSSVGPGAFAALRNAEELAMVIAS